ncbi:MAG: restriction endonuclease [Rhodospirillales bacterium]|jgi:putative restriction endonuclease|nr:restriction endonuclease [Rhodospirillales bacterium]MBT4040905.1 restriction endonuclease [Rhodospirillales bacterium]MBT4625764.1 restriction endonuclease [Rhodospirillales bacterium]MBT5352638.1 restriction endonuclease [Rhodospirillales bacterium]MBT5521726.1 restriction endonuclease [Rhodospirillales bacterium]
MVKAVFTTKEISIYNDRPWEFYNFPKTYLNQVEQTVGDLIIYYEPRRISKDLSSRGGMQSYFAVGHVSGIRSDPDREDHFYADIENYVRFEEPVPFRHSDGYFEGNLQRDDGGTNKGAFGRAVRLLRDEEFDLIVRTGFTESLLEPSETQIYSGGLNEPPASFERPIISTIVSRPFRKRAFALQVQKAYDNRCAVTGLRLTNGGGRPEIEAAHIRPVAEDGPDMVQNGIALSRTAHWMFDRGLISISDDMKILRSKKYAMGDAERLINPDGALILPENTALHPHPTFLHFHREAVFCE